jgi:hypothetical protein
MRIKEILVAAGALAASTGTAFAQAAERAGAPLDDASGMGGGSSLLIIALVVALGIGIYFITKGDDNGPDSP